MKKLEFATALYSALTSTSVETPISTNVENQWVLAQLDNNTFTLNGKWVVLGYKVVAKPTRNGEYELTTIGKELFNQQ